MKSFSTLSKSSPGYELVVLLTRLCKTQAHTQCHVHGFYLFSYKVQTLQRAAAFDVYGMFADSGNWMLVNQFGKYLLLQSSACFPGQSLIDPISKFTAFGWWKNRTLPCDRLWIFNLSESLVWPAISLFSS